MDENDYSVKTLQRAASSLQGAIVQIGPGNAPTRIDQAFGILSSIVVEPGLGTTATWIMFGQQVDGPYPGRHRAGNGIVLFAGRHPDSATHFPRALKSSLAVRRRNHYPGCGWASPHDHDGFLEFVNHPAAADAFRVPRFQAVKAQEKERDLNHLDQAEPAEKSLSKLGKQSAGAWILVRNL